MPAIGFKSITIKSFVYDDIFETYNKHKKELTKEGINSFAGYVQYVLYKYGRDIDDT